MLKPSQSVLWAFLVVMAAALPFGAAEGSAAGAAPKPSAPPPAAPAPAAGQSAPQPLSETQVGADRKLDERLARAGNGLEGQTLICLRLAWDQSEPDGALRDAALRRLRSTDPRVVADGFVELLDASTPPARIGMIELMADLYPGLGGVHSFLDSTLCNQIRSPYRDVAQATITVCSRLRIADSYLPMREIASRPAHPLNKEAIAGLAQLGDPRAVGFFTTLLQTGAAPRDEIFQALARIGRPAALLLKTKLDDPDPAVRSAALEALLSIATGDDLTALYTYVQKYPPQGDLKKRIYDSIAEIEAAQSQRPLNND